jgi:hypothetical protein
MIDPLLALLDWNNRALSPSWNQSFSSLARQAGDLGFQFFY